MKFLKFFEYGGFEKSLGEESNSISDLNLTDAELQYLRSISEKTIIGSPIFEITQSKINATSIVGVIAFDGVHIEILPKLLRNNRSSNNNNNSSILQNLMFMLSYTNELDIYDSGVGSLSENSDSFIEAYIAIFADRLSKHLIRHGSPKAYVEKNENLNTVKGKIDFAKQSTINCFNQSRIYCNYAEFTEDNGLSRAFKFVSQSLIQLTKSSSNTSVLNRCIGLLDGVKGEYITGSEIDRLSIGKRNQNFIALINLTKMFLKKMRPEFSGQKKNKAFTLLFDMNELFEEFVFMVLKRNESYLNIKVQAQKHKRLVNAERDFLRDGEWQNRALFATYTDISITLSDGRIFIIDTKYKVVHSGKNHYGISNQDAYQILAYRQIHKDEVEPSVVLLYPRSKEDLQKEFRINGSETTFMAWTVDISVDLGKNMNLLVENLRNLITVVEQKSS
ncbi:MAG: McrC family protein [Bdellovibrionaceae bacterium]|nr:McrC family protein [Pseudobdellovibrionaceae bacterium]